MLLKRIFKIFFCSTFIFALASLPAKAQTEYVQLERNSDIRIFGRYLSLLESTGDILDFKKISLNDNKWKTISSEYHNTITSVNYSPEGNVVIKNDRFGFTIFFIPQYLGNRIRWTCKIEEYKSHFFSPKNCSSWSKEINSLTHHSSGSPNGVP